MLLHYSRHAARALAALFIAAGAAAAGFTPNMPAGGGLVPGAAPHDSGYLCVGLEEGFTNAYVTMLRMDPNSNNRLVIRSGGGRIKNLYGAGPVFANCPPVVVAKDPNNCYVLAFSGRLNADTLNAYPYTNGVQQKDSAGRWGEIPVPVSAYTNPGMFGAAAMPDGRGMIVAAAKYVGNQIAIGVTYLEWGLGADWTLTRVAETTLPAPPGAGASYRANINLAVTHNFDSAARWYPYRLVLGLKDTSGNARIHEYRLNTKMSGDLLNRYFVTPVPGDDEWRTLTTGAENVGLSMHTGMDGRAYVAVQKADTIEIFARTGYDANQKAVWENTEHLPRTSYEYLPTFVYKPVYNTGQPSAPIPINRVGFFVAGQGTGSRGYDDAFGLARRRDLPQSATSSAGVVVGIVDGPPPIPDENLKLYGSQSVNSAFNFAYNNTSQKSTTATFGQGVTMGASGTLGGDFKGFGASVEIEKEVSEKFQSSYSEQSGSRSEQYLAVQSGTFPSDDGSHEVTKPLGTLFVATMSFGGATYEFGSMQNGQFVPTPGGLVFTQLWPKGSYNIQPRSWWMNPNGRIPGNIRSYEAQPGETEALDAISKIHFSGLTGDTNYLAFSMSDDSYSRTAYDYFSGLTRSEETSISTREALKVSVTTPIGGASVSAAQDTDVSRAWDVGSDSSVGISVYTEVQNDRRSSAPPNYFSLTYQTYLLKDDNAYLRELLSDDPNGIGMVTSIWPPPGSEERRQNEELKALLIRSSKPWKVTYVVTNAAMNRPLNPAAYGATPEGDLLQRLQRQGLNSTAGIDSLLRASTGRGKAPTMAVRSALSGLSGTDLRLLRGIMEKDEAEARAAWRKAHPTRYTFMDTLKEMEKPDIGSTRPFFTTVPPEGL